MPDCSNKGMSPNIYQEGRFWVISLCMGAAITMLYDCFRIVRRVVRHSNFWISMEDLLYWIVVSLGVFGILYYENDGVLRWFAVLGAAVGMVVYKGILGHFLVESLSELLIYGKKQLLRFGRWLFGPWRKIKFILTGKMHAGKLRLRSLIRLLKKRLTVAVRLFKIVLHTHYQKMDQRRGKWSEEKSSSKRKKRID